MVKHTVRGNVSLYMTIEDEELVHILVKEKESIFGSDNYMDSEGNIFERPYGQYKERLIGKADDEGKLQYEALKTVIGMVESRGKNS